LRATKEGGGRDIGDEEKGKGKGKKDAKPSLCGLPRKSSDLKDAVVAEEDRFRLDDPEGEGNKSEEESVVGEETGEDKKEIKQERGERRGDVEIVEGKGDNNDGNDGIGQGTDFEMGGADEKLGWGGFEENKVEFSIPNQFRKFHKSGHEKSSEDLLDELVGCDKDDHLGSAPARDRIDVLIHDADKGELENKPSELDDDPDKKISPERELAGGGITNLDKPETEEVKQRRHLTLQRRCIF
jgi:hypothetical protein